jgi:hypothetical protein
MKKRTPRSKHPGPRRHFLALLGAAAAAVSLPLVARRAGPRELALREADFYRPHDLAG